MKTRPAIIAKTFKGNLSRWKKGEVVIARQTGPAEFFVERMQWSGRLELQNQIAGVPREFLKFNE